MNDIINKFPIETEITQQILDSITERGRNNAHYCIGATTLKSVLPNLSDKIFWGRTTGAIYHKDGKINITTKELIDMPSVTEPIKITFVIN
jgi:hypothetical protein